MINLPTRVRVLSGVIASTQADLEAKKAILAQANGDIRLCNENEVLLKKVEALIATTINTLYTGSTDTLATTLNHGLAATYPRELRTVVERSISGGRPTLAIKLIDSSVGDQTPLAPDEAHGGGVAEILGILCRAVLIIASGKRRLMVLDEPSSAVSIDIQPALSALLASLVSDLGFQIRYQ